ncbi:hypothetical protein Ancab_014579, partial [Ancistrocladus abbreviatus]
MKRLIEEAPCMMVLEVMKTWEGCCGADCAAVHGIATGVLTLTRSWLNDAIEFQVSKNWVLFGWAGIGVQQLSSMNLRLV